jgi:hypothetical protein
VGEDRRLAVIALVVVGAAVLTFLVLHWRHGAGGRAPERLWFEDLAATTPPAEGDLEAIADWLRARLLEGSGVEPPAIADVRPRIVFLTLGDGRTPGTVIAGKGEGLVEAAERALAAAVTRGGRSWDRMRLDLVTRVLDDQPVTPRGRLDFERGLDGLAFDGRSGIAFLPDEVVVRTLVNSDGELRASNVEKYLRQLDSPLADELDRLWRTGEAEVRRFRTRAIFVIGDRSMPLYRGHRVPSRVDADELLDAARSAGDYLRRAVRDDGSFVYAYLAKTDREKDDYNLLRHAGTAYSMLELFQETADEALLAAAGRALDHLRHRIVDCRAGAERGSCVIEKGFVKLGGNALAILALARHAEATGDRTDLPLMSNLARWMTSVQTSSGEFTIHKLELDTGEVDDHISEYYPGEALFALARLHRLDGDPAWLSAAARGAEWLITQRDGDLADDQLSHDHWLLYALNEITAIQGKDADPLFGEHALRLARVIVSAQNRRPQFPDWLGSYYKPPRSTPTATRSEGLCAAYLLARRLGRDAEAADILEAARLGVEFQLQLQFRPESTLFLPDPARASGGLPRSLTDFEIRIDYVQHSLSSFLALRRILLQDAGQTPA